jgi:hypothetical protein
MISVKYDLLPGFKLKECKKAQNAEDFPLRWSQ